MVKTIAEESYSFKIYNFLFEFFTWGYMAEIFFGILISMAVFMLAMLCTNHKLFSFLFRDRLYFVKNYLFYFSLQKKTFIKSFYYVIKKDFLKKYWIYLVIMAVALIFMVMIIWWAINFSKPL